MFSAEQSVRASRGLLLLAALVAGCSDDDRTLPGLQPNPEAGTDVPQADSGPKPDADAEPDAAVVTANAGADQVVSAGAQVTLPGQGSNSSGASISYSWTQVAGPTLVLSASDQAAATFTAPLVSAELEFQLVVRSVNGRASDSVKVEVGAAPVLLVANRGNGSVARFAIGPGLNGDIAPQTTWLGARTRLRAPSALVVDKVGGLLVSNADTNRITGFASAFGPAGDVVPERYVGGALLALNQPEALAQDRAADRLFVGSFDAFPGTINVFSDVSTRAFTGEVQPVGRLQSVAIANVRDLELGPSGELYVVNGGNHNITVFANAGAINGEANPSRTIDSAAFVDRVLMDAFLDANDRLYVVGATTGEVLVFENASGLSGNVTPSRTITVTAIGAQGFAGITIDSAGTAYITDAVVNAFYAIDAVASRDGTIVPDRIVTGNATGLSAPAHLSAVAP